MSSEQPTTGDKYDELLRIVVVERQIAKESTERAIDALTRLGDPFRRVRTKFDQADNHLGTAQLLLDKTLRTLGIDAPDGFATATERPPEPAAAADHVAQPTYFRAGDVAGSTYAPLTFVWTLGNPQAPSKAVRPVVVPWQGELCRGPHCHAGLHWLHRHDGRADRIALNRAPLEEVGAPFERAGYWVSDEDAVAYEVSRATAVDAIASGLPVYRSHQFLCPDRDLWTRRQP